MTRISSEQLRSLRVRAQRLHSKAPRGQMAEVVRSLCGVNAQFSPAMLLSLRARVEQLQASDVAEALGQKRLVRTWAMRGTLHLLDPDDLGWMVSLLGPAAIAKGRRRRRELGLTDGVLAKSLCEMPDILKDGPLARGELVDRLIGRGITIGGGQAPYHLIAYAALNGLIRMGPDGPDGGPIYGLADSRGGEHYSRDEALALLAHRYFGGYGPATPQDFASWSGLSMADAKGGWELNKKGLEELEVDGRALYSRDIPSRPAYAGPVVNLLPAFDAYILGYSDREHLVRPEHQKMVYHGGQTAPVVLVDGLAAGVWRYERRGKKISVKICPFEPLGNEVKGLVEEEARDVGRLFGASVSLFYA